MPLGVSRSPTQQLHSSSRNKTVTFLAVFDEASKQDSPSLTPCDLFVQALEEAAAEAAEEERRRLLTQTELQDRYRTDLEREKLVSPTQNAGLHQAMVQVGFRRSYLSFLRC